MKVILSTGSLQNTMNGIGRYTYELGVRLQNQTEIEQLQFFSRLGFQKQLSNNRKPKKQGGSVRSLLKKKILRIGFQLFGPLIQRLRLRKYSDWLFHSTNFYVPKMAGKKIVTIHDLSVIKYPEFHPADRVRHIRSSIRQALQSVDLVITDSETVRKEILQIYTIDAERVISIPLACGTEFTPRSSEDTKSTLLKYGLVHESYALTVSTIEPRKNISRIIQSYRNLPTELRSLYPLVVVGPLGWHCAEIHAELLKAADEGWLKYLGYAQNKELPFLYSGARCFLFPSIYEGFGLPVLESMASGVPVLTSKGSSMEEIALDTALYCDPFDINEMSQRINLLLRDNKLRKKLGAESLIQSGRFSWDDTARKTVDAYRLAFSNKN